MHVRVEILIYTTNCVSGVQCSSYPANGHACPPTPPQRANAPSECSTPSASAADLLTPKTSTPKSPTSQISPHSELPGIECEDAGLSRRNSLCDDEDESPIMASGPTNVPLTPRHMRRDENTPATRSSMSNSLTLSNQNITPNAEKTDVTEAGCPDKPASCKVKQPPKTSRQPAKATQKGSTFGKKGNSSRPSRKALLFSKLKKHQGHGKPLSSALDSCKSPPEYHFPDEEEVAKPEKTNGRRRSTRRNSSMNAAAEMKVFSRL